MPLLVRFHKRKAFLRDGHWRCADTALESALNAATAGWIRDTGGPPLGVPDQERAVAAEMAGRWGGKIILHLASRSGKAEAYFLEQRQMRLDFDSALPMPKRKSAAGA